MSEKKITRIASNGKPYKEVLAEFVSEDKEKLLVDDCQKEVLSEESIPKKKSRRKRKTDE